MKVPITYYLFATEKNEILGSVGDAEHRKKKKPTGRKRGSSEESQHQLLPALLLVAARSTTRELLLLPAIERRVLSISIEKNLKILLYVRHRT
jgi:hypothetical protein